MKKQYAKVFLFGFVLLSSSKNFTMDALEDPRDLINFFEERQEYLHQISDQSSNKETIQFNEYSSDDNQNDSEDLNENQTPQVISKMSSFAHSFCALYAGLVLAIFYHQLSN
ncbi:MAG: hypothetical protein ACOYT8_05985 [Candidatus Dependentiae bacterium]